MKNLLCKLSVEVQSLIINKRRLYFNLFNSEENQEEILSPELQAFLPSSI